MILFTQKLLFVHNPKTAGTSLVEYFGAILPGPIYRAGVNELGTYHPSLSMALGYACAITKNRPTDFQRIISPIRDPFDREVSMYLYFRDVLCKSPNVGADLNNRDIERAVRMTLRLDFPDYLSWVWDEFGTLDIWHSRCFYRTAERGTPKNLFVVRTEHIEADLAAALAGIALDANSASLARLNVSDRSAVGISFTPYARQLVIQSYQWMFEEGLYAEGSAETEFTKTSTRRSPVEL